MKDIAMCSTSYSTFPGENTCALKAKIDDISPSKLISSIHSKCTGVILSRAHISLLSILIGEMLFKVAAYVQPNVDTGEVKTKRGRKKDVENSGIPKRTKLDMLPVNDLTWPELARRYIVVILSMEGKLDSVEITSRESGKVFHCLQGDGGTLCGSLTGVTAMEADALVRINLIQLS